MDIQFLLVCILLIFLSGRKIISIPLDVDEVINIGIIYHKDITLSNIGQIYLQMLKDLLKNNCLNNYFL